MLKYIEAAGVTEEVHKFLGDISRLAGYTPPELGLGL